MAVHKMKIAGLERELPLCPVNEHLDIGAFIIFGDVELTIAAASEIIKKCPDFDYIVTPEAKSIPLAVGQKILCNSQKAQGLYDRPRYGTC